MGRLAVIHPAAEVREDVGSLFAWAEKQAVEAAMASDRLKYAVRAQRAAEADLKGLRQFAAVESARQELANAKKAALEEDPAVADAAKALKKARKRLKETTEARDLKVRKQEAQAAEAAARGASRALVARLAKRDEAEVVTEAGAVEVE